MKLISKFAKLAIAIVLIFPGCSLFPERAYSPALHDFGPSTKFVDCKSPGSLGSTWSTVSVEAPEWLQNENIRYRLLYIDPTRVRFYALDRWLAFPTAMLAQRLSADGCHNGWPLSIRLIEFEQVFDGPQTARVILVFHAYVHPPASEEIIGDKVFSFSLPTATADAKGTIGASVILVDEAVNSLRSWFTELSYRH